MLERLPRIQIRVLANDKVYSTRWIMLGKSIKEISSVLDGVAMAAKCGWSISVGGGKVIPAQSVQAILIERVL